MRSFGLSLIILAIIFLSFITIFNDQFFELYHHLNTVIKLCLLFILFIGLISGILITPQINNWTKGILSGLILGILCGPLGLIISIVFLAFVGDSTSLMMAVSTSSLCWLFFCFFCLGYFVVFLPRYIKLIKEADVNENDSYNY